MNFFQKNSSPLAGTFPIYKIMAIRSEVTLDTTKARGEARRASAEIAKSMSAAASGGGGGGGKSMTDGAESKLTKISSAGNIIGMALQAGKALYDVSKDAVKTGVELGKTFDDLKGGLKQVLPAGADVENEMSRIQSLMNQPGVEWESAIRAHTTLISLGKSADESAEMITELGNVLKSTGDDQPGRLEEFVETLTKIDDKGKPAIKQITALAEKTTGVRVALERAFSTSNASKLEGMKLSAKDFQEGLVAGLKGLDRASLDSKDLLDKEADALKLKARLVSSASIAATPGRAGSAGDPSVAAAFRKEVEEGEAARIASLMKAKDLETALAEIKIKESAIEAEIAESLPTQRKQLQEDLELWRERADIASLELEKSKELEKIMEEQNLTAEQGEALLKRKVEAARHLEDQEKASADAAKSRENARTLASDTTQRAIDKARASGNNRRADKLQRAADLEASTTEGLNMKLSPEAAAARAKDIQQTREDQAYRDRTGRSRIHGGGPTTGFSGIDDSLATHHRAPLGLQGRMSDAAFPSLDKMAAAQAARDKSRDPLVRPVQPVPAGAGGENALLKALERIEATLKTAVGKEVAKPLSAA